jgi:hypothetical protein
MINNGKAPTALASLIAVRRVKVQAGMSGSTFACAHQTISVSIKNLHSDRIYEYSPNRVKVSERDVALSGPSETSLPAAKTCRLQLCTVYLVRGIS